MRKKIFISAVAVMMAAACNAQGKMTRISGQLTGLGDSLLYNMIDMNLDNPRSKGTYACKDGKFDLQVNVEHPATFAIMDLKAANSEDAATTMKVAYFTVIPGEDAIVNGSLEDYKIGGNEIYQRMSDYQNKMMEFFENATNDNLASKQTDFGKYALNVIRKNPKDEAAMIMVQGLSDGDFKKALELFDPSVREGRMAGLWKPLVKMKESQAKREEAAQKVAPGKPAPDFTLPDINGKDFSLSGLRGKYVILDFWGSWCGWCIKGMPEMKKYYEKYKGKFEIVGVDCNDTEDKWKNAVEKYKLPWLHVRQSNETVNVSDSYGISGFPTKIIINPDGTINKVIVGESADFYTYLDSLFK